MAVWLGKSPTGQGWRYLHEDGRVEDVDTDALGMPPGWAPEGFEPDLGAQTDFAGATQAAPQDVPANQPPEAAPPAPEAAPAAPPAAASPPAPGPTSTSSSSAASYRGPTLTFDTAPVAGNKLTQAAAREANAYGQALQPSVQREAGAIAAESELLARSTEAQRFGALDEAAAIRKQQEQRALEVDAISKRSSEWTSQIQEAINSVPTIDSRKVFYDQSSSESAAMGVAMFMGGFLQPVLGTNQPMDIINKAIDRSIADQRANAEQAQRKVWNLKDLAARDENSALWELNQKDIARAAHLTALQRDVQAQALGYQSDVYRQKGQQLLAKLEQGYNETIRNMMVKTRDFLLETYKASITAMSVRNAEAARQAEAGRQAAAARQATFLHRDTGIRAQGPNARNGGGWYAPNDKVREKAAETFTKGQDSWGKLENLKRLSTQGHFGLPGSEERARAAAAASQVVIGIMSDVSGLGQKEDARRLMAQVGGDPDAFFRMADEKTIKKVLADSQDAVQRSMNNFAKGLQYDPNDRVTWEPNVAPVEAEASGPALGSGALRVKAAMASERPRPEELMGGLQDIKAELDTYPDLASTPEGKAQVQSWLAVLNQLPEAQRTALVDGQYVDMRDVVIQALTQGDRTSQFNDLRNEALQKYPPETRPMGGYNGPVK